MNRLLHLFVLITCSLLLASNVQATWSIILVDSATGTIGIAGASCTPSVYGIGSIVPGKGAVVVQAWSNGEARRRAVDMIKSGMSPVSILEAIRDPHYDPEHQQYAILVLSAYGSPVVYTGTECTPYKKALTGPGVSVQGNTLTHDSELDSVMAAVADGRQKKLPLQEILLRALEAGARAGGDSRCGERKASSAFLTVMHPQDDPQKPWLNLVVIQQDQTTPAVQRLRAVYEQWKAKTDV